MRPPFTSRRPCAGSMRCSASHDSPPSSHFRHTCAPIAGEFAQDYFQLATNSATHGSMALTSCFSTSLHLQQMVSASSRHSPVLPHTLSAHYSISPLVSCRSLPSHYYACPPSSAALGVLTLLLMPVGFYLGLHWSTFPAWRHMWAVSLLFGTAACYVCARPRALWWLFLPDKSAGALRSQG